jgi:rubrerythrin
MDDAQQTTLESLQTAIQMEIDGREYYQQASQKAENEAGRKLLAQLAKEEDIHRQVFQRIYDSISRKNEWPETPPVADGGQALRTIFGRAINESQTGSKTAETELDAVRTAIDMENRTLDYYRQQSRDAVYPAAREFYLALAGQEAEHARLLLDYFEYLTNPAAYFVNTEHPSLDG